MLASDDGVTIHNNAITNWDKRIRFHPEGFFHPWDHRLLCRIPDDWMQISYNNVPGMYLDCKSCSCIKSEGGSIPQKSFHTFSFQGNSDSMKSRWNRNVDVKKYHFPFSFSWPLKRWTILQQCMQMTFCSTCYHTTKCIHHSKGLKNSKKKHFSVKSSFLKVVRILEWYKSSKQQRSKGMHGHVELHFMSSFLLQLLTATHFPEA